MDITLEISGSKSLPSRALAALSRKAAARGIPLEELIAETLIHAADKPKPRPKPKK